METKTTEVKTTTDGFVIPAHLWDEINTSCAAAVNQQKSSVRSRVGRQIGHVAFGVGMLYGIIKNAPSRLDRDHHIRDRFQEGYAKATEPVETDQLNRAITIQSAEAGKALEGIRVKSEKDLLRLFATVGMSAKERNRLMNLVDAIQNPEALPEQERFLDSRSGNDNGTGGSGKRSGRSSPRKPVPADSNSQLFENV